MKEINLITYGRMAEEFERHILDNYPEIKVIRPANIKELEKQICKANAFAGFDVLEQFDLSGIEWIHSFGAGVDSFLYKTSTYQNEIIITRTTGKLGRKIGEYCLAYILAKYNHVFQTYKQQQQRSWIQIQSEKLYEKNILVIGTGAIGEGVAKTFRGKVNCLVGVNSSRKENGNFDKVKTLKELGNENIDIIINTLPNTLFTKSILNREFFTQFDNAIFINVGRGDTVDDVDLIEAIDNNNLSWAVLDVFKNEPLPRDSKLWDHDKIVITPHQAGLTDIADIKTDFDLAYNGIKNNSRNNLFVDSNKGY